MIRIIEFLKSHKAIADVLAFLYNICHHNRGYMFYVLFGKGHINGVFMKNVKLTITGKNAKLCIGRRTQLYNCQIILTGEKTSLYIEGTGTNINNASFVMAENGSRISVGSGFTMQGGYIRSLEGAPIKIGSDCMFSSDIDIASGDYHTINDLQTKKRINDSKEIVISDHVWLGAHSKVLKGAFIPKNCIIGNSAVVAGRLQEPHSIYVGVPAKLIKRGVDWNRDRNL